MPGERSTPSAAPLRVSHVERFSHPKDRFVLNPRDASDALCLFQLLAASLYLVLVCLGPFLTPPCQLRPPPGKHWINPMYNGDPCLDVRYLVLGGLTLREASMARNIYVALFLGALVGYERRSPDRPAGIRTMSLTSIGVACFTLSSMFAFQSGPMKWDSSRITADIPKGIGFLAGAVIYKGSVMSQNLGKEIQQVHGLTTATTMWLAAAVGALCGGGLMSYALMLVTVIVLMLRFGPRNSELELDMIAEDENGEGGEEEEDEGEAGQQGQVAAETASVAASITSRQSNASMRTASTLQYLGREIRTEQRYALIHEEVQSTPSEFFKETVTLTFPPTCLLPKRENHLTTADLPSLPQLTVSLISVPSCYHTPTSIPINLTTPVV